MFFFFYLFMLFFLPIQLFISFYFFVLYELFILSILSQFQNVLGLIFGFTLSLNSCCDVDVIWYVYACVYVMCYGMFMHVCTHPYSCHSMFVVVRRHQPQGLALSFPHMESGDCTEITSHGIKQAPLLLSYLAVPFLDFIKRILERINLKFQGIK